MPDNNKNKQEFADRTSKPITTDKDIVEAKEEGKEQGEQLIDTLKNKNFSRLDPFIDEPSNLLAYDSGAEESAQIVEEGYDALDRQIGEAIRQAQESGEDIINEFNVMLAMMRKPVTNIPMQPAMRKPKDTQKTNVKKPEVERINPKDIKTVKKVSDKEIIETRDGKRYIRGKYVAKGNKFVPATYEDFLAGDNIIDEDNIIDYTAKFTQRGGIYDFIDKAYTDGRNVANISGRYYDLSGLNDFNFFASQKEMEMFGEEYQSVLGALTNAVAGGFINIAGGAIAAVSSIPSFLTDDYDNAGFGLSESINKWVYENLPAYSSGDMSKFGYWANQVQSLGFSVGIVGEQLLENILLTSLTGGLAAATSAVRVKNLLSAMRVGMRYSFPVMMSLRETQMNAAETYKSVYDTLKNAGIDDEEAKAMAVEAADSRFWNELFINAFMVPFTYFRTLGGAVNKIKGRYAKAIADAELSQLEKAVMKAEMRLGKAVKGLDESIEKSAVGGIYKGVKGAFDSSAGKLLTGIGAEGLEEYYQEYFGELSENRALSYYGLAARKNLWDIAKSDRVIDAFIGGAMGGALFSIAGKIIEKYAGKDDDKLKKMNELLEKSFDYTALLNHYGALEPVIGHDKDYQEKSSRDRALLSMLIDNLYSDDINIDNLYNNEIDRLNKSKNKHIEIIDDANTKEDVLSYMGKMFMDTSKIEDAKDVDEAKMLAKEKINSIYDEQVKYLDEARAELDSILNDPDIKNKVSNIKDGNIRNRILWNEYIRNEIARANDNIKQSLPTLLKTIKETLDKKQFDEKSINDVVRSIFLGYINSQIDYVKERIEQSVTKNKHKENILKILESKKKDVEKELKSSNNEKVEVIKGLIKKNKALYKYIRKKVDLEVNKLLDKIIKTENEHLISDRDVTMEVIGEGHIRRIQKSIDNGNYNYAMMLLNDAIQRGYISQETYDVFNTKISNELNKKLKPDDILEKPGITNKIIDDTIDKVDKSNIDDERKSRFKNILSSTFQKIKDLYNKYKNNSNNDEKRSLANQIGKLTEDIHEAIDEINDELKKEKKVDITSADGLSIAMELDNSLEGSGNMFDGVKLFTLSYKANNGLLDKNSKEYLELSYVIEELYKDSNNNFSEFINNLLSVIDRRLLNISARVIAHILNDSLGIPYEDMLSLILAHSSIINLDVNNISSINVSSLRISVEDTNGVSVRNDNSYLKTNTPSFGIRFEKSNDDDNKYDYYVDDNIDLNARLSLKKWNEKESKYDNVELFFGVDDDFINTNITWVNTDGNVLYTTYAQMIRDVFKEDINNIDELRELFFKHSNNPLAYRYIIGYLPITIKDKSGNVLGYMPTELKGISRSIYMSKNRNISLFDYHSDLFPKNEEYLLKERLLVFLGEVKEFRVSDIVSGGMLKSDKKVSLNDVKDIAKLTVVIPGSERIRKGLNETKKLYSTIANTSSSFFNTDDEIHKGKVFFANSNDAKGRKVVIAFKSRAPKDYYVISDFDVGTYTERDKDEVKDYIKVFLSDYYNNKKTYNILAHIAARMPYFTDKDQYDNNNIGMYVDKDKGIIYIKGGKKEVIVNRHNYNESVTLDKINDIIDNNLVGKNVYIDNDFYYEIIRDNVDNIIPVFEDRIRVSVGYWEMNGEKHIENGITFSYKYPDKRIKHAYKSLVEIANMVPQAYFYGLSNIVSANETEVDLSITNSIREKYGNITEYKTSSGIVYSVLDNNNELFFVTNGIDLDNSDMDSFNGFISYGTIRDYNFITKTEIVDTKEVKNLIEKICKN